MLRSGGVIEIARAAKIDRVTLYRAFRLERGPALDNMIKVLRVLGFRLVVEVRREVANSHEGLPESWVECGEKASRCVLRVGSRLHSKAGKWTNLLKSSSKPCASKKTLRSLREKRSGRARRFIAFLHKIPMPRFRTLLSFLNALELRFAVRRLPRSETLTKTLE